MKAPFSYSDTWQDRVMLRLKQKVQSKWVPLFGLIIL